MYRRRRLALLSAFLVILLGGYTALDANDVVPGVLTREAPWPDPEPYPQVVAGAPAAAPDRVAGSAEDAPLPQTDALAALSSDLVASGAVGPSPGLLVTDVLTGEDLYGARATESYVPASSLKLLAGVAVVASYGDQHRFTTSVVDSGEDVVTLVAGGDLTLAAGEGDPDAVIGHAGLADLAAEVAAELAAQGRTEVQVALDDTLFTGPELAPRWGDVDLSGGWAMPMAPIAVDVGRREGTNVRSSDAGMDAAEAFADALAAAGISVSGDVSRAAAPEGATVLGSVESAPLRDLVSYTLQHSENILSEVLGRMTAVSTGHEASFAGAGEAVLAVLAELGLDTSGSSLADTSGLSSESVLTARLLTDAVRLAADGSHPELRSVVDALPVAGLEGTLASRLADTAATGTVRAKTGTLPQVVALTGIVTTDEGRLLAFAVLANDFDQGSAYLARIAVDEWISEVAACGCSSP
ncbi:D-alanyl-D-alanine carboxypeptidase/D-alanyl-D-alanine endopeptidase [Ruania halotolerans]|uniref:D-alanyl-D-alanine carboxypeptidase/D-alanyl-D-alanine endopeptidase n=1 Tax=Ruania halotolerans TaxID=2897773 RepID=UPI001E415A37|nr:D-alanyl-D-alanine carboxypeptidase/D-alanyl-D-alanine-endopeptidase [Ruania halotolerans]UFU07165.1 D-alanyl-D-alanine carboxypeptidase/D-alanyl-D-alanine-endopeptidase [Ruania halotolerans]